MSAHSTIPLKLTGIERDVLRSRRELNMQERREQVFNAAREILIARPDDFSMRNLATEAGVSVRTIYNLVGERSDVLLAIVTRLGVHLHDVRRSSHENVFHRLLDEIEEARNVDLVNNEGLAAIRALRLLGPSYLARRVHTLLQAEYQPDFALAMEQGDLRADVASEDLTAMLAGLVTHAANCWSNDGDALAYRERAAHALAMTLLISATAENRSRCLAVLNARSDTATA